MELPEVAELDINPVVARPEEIVCVDIKVRLAPATTTSFDAAPTLSRPAVATTTPNVAHQSQGGVMNDAIITVATDGSAGSRRALEWALEEAERQHCGIELVAVYSATDDESRRTRSRAAPCTTSTRPWTTSWLDVSSFLPCRGRLSRESPPTSSSANRSTAGFS